jgi:hypothetical protein
MLWLTNTMYSVTLEMLVTFVAEQHACQICFGLQGCVTNPFSEYHVYIDHILRHRRAVKRIG